MEAYLARRDIAIVAFGATSENASFPVDCYQTMAEAFALKMADAADAVIYHDLNYFYTADAGIGAIHMSVEEGEAYLETICHSLVNQGFRRIAVISASPQGWLTGGVLALDFFDDTKVNLWNIDIRTALSWFAKDSGVTMDDFNDLLIGSYKVMGRLSDLVIDPSFEELPVKPSEPASRFPTLLANTFPAGASAFLSAYEYRNAVENQGLRSIEERDARAARGEQLINKFLAVMNPAELFRIQKEMDEWTHSKVLNRYSHFPRNKQPNAKV